MADKFSPLLSVGQWDIHIRYGKEAPVGNPPVHPALPEVSSPMDETSTPSGTKFLKDIYIIAEFEIVFDQDDSLRQMVGPDMVIQLRKDAIPFYVYGARLIPFGDRADVKCVIDNLVVKNVIIPVSEASDWAAPLVVIWSGKSGKIRLCVDHTRLKKFVLRPTHPTRTPRNAVVEMDSECQYSTSFYAANVYYQIPLQPFHPASI